jgi:hypothetical protein
VVSTPTIHLVSAGQLQVKSDLHTQVPALQGIYQVWYHLIAGTVYVHRVIHRPLALSSDAKLVIYATNIAFSTLGRQRHLAHWSTGKSAPLALSFASKMASYFC